MKVEVCEELNQQQRSVVCNFFVERYNKGGGLRVGVTGERKWMRCRENKGQGRGDACKFLEPSKSKLVLGEKVYCSIKM